MLNVATSATAYTSDDISLVRVQILFLDLQLELSIGPG